MKNKNVLLQKIISFSYHTSNQLLVGFLMMLSNMLVVVSAHSQDIHYVNQDLTKTIINPSYAGLNNKDLMAGIIYRDQWSQLQKIFKTYSFASELLLNSQNRSNSGNLGFGLWFDKDDAGTTRISTNQLGISVAYHTKIATHHYFSGGIYGGMLNKHLLDDNMQWGTQYNGDYYDNSLPSKENIAYFSYTKPDVGAGISYLFNNRDEKQVGQMVRVGIAMYHVNKPDMSFTDVQTDKIYQNLIVNASGIFDIKRSIISINPACTYMQQGPSHEILMGVNGIFDITKSKMKGSNIKDMWVGIHYRAKDAAIMEIGLRSYDISVTFSYDWTVSPLKGNSGLGAFEIGVKYDKNVFKHSGNRLL